MFTATFKYEDWKLTVDSNKNIVTVTKGAEKRIYDMPHQIESVGQLQHLPEYVRIYFEEVNEYLQFKFEADNFLVGDLWKIGDTFIREFACFVFGEDE